MVLVFEEHYRFLSGFQGDFFVLGTRDLVSADVGVRHFRRRVKETEAEARDKETTQTLVDFLFADEAFLDGFDEGKVFVAASQVRAGFDGFGGGFGQ